MGCKLKKAVLTVCCIFLPFLAINARKTFFLDLCYHSAAPAIIFESNQGYSQINAEEKALLKLLKSGKDMLNKNNDSINFLIHKTDMIRREKNCTFIGKALANFYYARLLTIKYQFNQANIVGRTSMLDVLPENIEEWSANNYKDQIYLACRDALSDPLSLKLMNLSAVSDFLEDNKPNADQNLFDVLSAGVLDISQQFIRFDYPIKEQSIKKMFSPIPEFLSCHWGENQDSFLSFILSIYQHELKFALADSDNEKLIEKDLERLAFVNSLDYNYAASYQTALEKLFEEYQTRPEAVLIALPLYTIYDNISDDDIFSPDNDKTEYLFEKSKDLLKRFPQAKGTCELQNFCYMLQAGNVRLMGDKIYYADHPVVLIADFKDTKQITVEITDSKNNVLQNRVLTSENQLIDEKQNISFPGMSYGEYKLMMTSIPQKMISMINEDGLNKNIPENQYADTVCFFISDLKLLTKKLPGNTLQLLVVDRKTGKPIKDASIDCFSLSHRKIKPVFLKSLKTDKDGLVNLDYKESGRMSFKVKKDSDIYYPKQEVYVSATRSDQIDVSSSERMEIYTDRSIYRPGQTVCFKGIYYHVDTEKAYALENKEVEVYLQNAQNKTIGTLSLKTDRFGAVSGEFKLPINDLKGYYSLRSSVKGVQVFQVADYKRPSFEVILDTPKNEYKEGDSISVEGVVKSYSGVNMEGATIRYTILYQTPYRFLSDYTIGSGITESTALGKFGIKFEAKIPRNVSDKRGIYIVTATATNEAGETQSGSVIIPIMSSSYSIRMSTDCFRKHYFESDITRNFWNKLEPVSLTVTAANWSGMPIDTIGELFFYRMASDTLAFPELKKDTSRIFVKKISFHTNKPVVIDANDLVSGCYELEARIVDHKGNISNGKEQVVVADPSSRRLPIVTSKWLYTSGLTAEPGSTVSLFFGTSAEKAYVLYQVITRDRMIENKRILLSDKITRIDIPYKKEYGSGFTVNLMYVKENSVIESSVVIKEKEPLRNLVIHKESFRDKLMPGMNETWTFRVADSLGNPVNAQVLADMYDSSLDQIYRNALWISTFPLLRPYLSFSNWRKYENNQWVIDERWNTMLDCQVANRTVLSDFGIQMIPAIRIRGASKIANAPAPEMLSVSEKSMNYSMDAIPGQDGVVETGSMSSPMTSAQEKFPLRTNLQETAFFYPNLVTDEKGNVNVRFLVPEALTRWNVRLLATTSDMYAGYLETDVTTTKELMVAPVIPQFVRQGDSICIASLIQNQSNNDLNGTVRFELFDPHTEKVIISDKSAFSCAKDANISVSFCAKISSDLDLLGIRIIAASPLYSDGEQQIIPVLPSSTLVTQAMPMSVAGKGDYSFRFEDYLNNQSKTLDNYSFTIEYTGNPAWYAVLALPALAEINNSSAMSAIASYYVNTLATHIAQDNPIIRKAISLWEKQDKKENTLISALKKNESLKQVLLSETPWVVEAMDETDNMQSLSLLFDTNRMNRFRDESVALLKSLQNADGGIACFRDMPSSLFQTLEMLDSFARLVSMNAFEAPEDIRMMMMNAISYSDKQILSNYDLYQKSNENSGWTPSLIDLQWAYVRSSYRDIPFYEGSLKIHKQILSYYRKDLETIYDSADLYTLGLLSLTLRRYGFIADADAINARLRSYATQSEETGMYWANNRGFRSAVGTIRTHVLLMNALFEGKASTQEMNQLRLWLLTQKQTQSWGNTPSTTDAIYGILMTNPSWLDNTQMPVIKTGNISISPNQYLAYADTSFSRSSMNRELGIIHINQSDDHPGYGSAYWQYFEKFNQIRENGKDLKISKKLFREIQTKEGATLEPVKGSLKPGDIVVTRFVIESKRNFEFVSLKDQRAACFQPLNQISGYSYSNGLSYYLQTNEATTDYFFTNLPEGTYVIEYKLKVVQKGIFNEGVSSIQCLYAPQFTGNTQGSMILVE